MLPQQGMRLSVDIGTMAIKPPRAIQHGYGSSHSVKAAAASTDQYSISGIWTAAVYLQLLRDEMHLFMVLT
jgi:hypothetical protein